MNNLISDVTNVDSSINASSVLSTDSLEDLRIQFNTLVKDVDSIQSAAITSNAILPVNSFEELRIQFNNLVVDVGNI